VLELIREQRPEIPFLFISGYSENAVHTRFVLDQGMEFLAKPFPPDELLRRVRDLIDRG
jgi:DNA-binding response OmpR family regulator